MELQRRRPVREGWRGALRGVVSRRTYEPSWEGGWRASWEGGWGAAPGQSPRTDPSDPIEPMCRVWLRRQRRRPRRRRWVSSAFLTRRSRSRARKMTSNSPPGSKVPDTERLLLQRLCASSRRMCPAAMERGQAGAAQIGLARSPPRLLSMRSLPQAHVPLSCVGTSVCVCRMRER